LALAGQQTQTTIYQVPGGGNRSRSGLLKGEIHMFTQLRGDCWYVDFGVPIGSEQGNRRPAVILSNDTGNINAPILTIAPLTSQPKNDQPTHVSVDTEWLPKDSTALLEQIRTVSKERLSDYLGTFSNRKMKQINAAIRVALNL
jgi:mRNA interferase MazF